MFTCQCHVIKIQFMSNQTYTLLKISFSNTMYQVKIVYSLHF